MIGANCIVAGSVDSDEKSPVRGGRDRASAKKLQDEKGSNVKQ